MAENVDVIVLGMGPGGEEAATRLLEAGLQVAVVERELIGGECAYWACIPSKTLLRPPEARSEADRAAGVSTPALEWSGIVEYRDYMTRHLDDQAQVRGYQDMGALVVRGTGRLTGPGQVEVDGRRLEAEQVILATGSDPVIPPVEGLDQVEVWTNREATQLRDVPGRALMIGGGPVCIELGQLLARLGSQVTMVQRTERLIDREDPRVGELIAKALSDEGVDVRVGRQVVRASRHGGGAAVELDDGTTVETDVIVAGAGRTPRTGGLGLENVGVEAGGQGVRVDDYCRVVGAEGLWAIGDVTGVALFTHVAKYQGRVVAGNLLGQPRRASYQGVPRVVFSDPEIAAVGLTEAQARQSQAGHDVVSATVSLPNAISRPYTYERDPRGEVRLVADRGRGVLLGAWAVAPLASEWIHQAALAIRAEVPIDVLLDGVAQYPTYSEAFLTALEQLR